MTEATGAAAPTHPPRVLSIIPPMTQLNTPYPSTAYLTGFLRERGVDAVQADLALALVLDLFSPTGLEAIRTRIQAIPARQRTPAAQLVGSGERQVIRLWPVSTK